MLRFAFIFHNLFLQSIIFINAKRNLILGDREVRQIFEIIKVSRKSISGR